MHLDVNRLLTEFLWHNGWLELDKIWLYVS